MTVVFGDRADFAIEAGVEPTLTVPSRVWGHMCVWCRGIPLGDFTNSHCGFGGPYQYFRLLPSLLDDLWAPELAGPDLETWNFLDGLLYGYHGDLEIADDRTLEQCRADWASWGRFNFLTNLEEMFDGFKSFILCVPGGSVRIFCRRFPAGRGICIDVSRAGILEACEGFTRWFELEEKRLGGS